MSAEGELPDVPPTPRTRNHTGLIAPLVAVTAGAWVFAFSSFLALMLFEHGVLSERMRELALAGGVLRVWQSLTAVLGIGLLAYTAALGRYRHVLTVLAVVAGIIGLAAVATGPEAGVRTRFDLMRPDLERAAQLPFVAEGSQPQYYADLPTDLAFLSTNGLVSTNGRGALFVPQWAGIPDDAGGYIFSPAGNPTGWEMWGMTCTYPVRLDGDWWACGMGEAD